ncbi:hypothetical protein GF337_13135 [candidate division KSB1 bacterium]|nr:hypothetical protein [candidate division KSB1 bacterium]
MPFYLVQAQTKSEKLDELRRALSKDEFIDMRPFGKAITKGLKGARINEEGTAFWEEEDYCVPPLKQERAAVLDHYFDDIKVARVKTGEGWRYIEKLPRLFPEFED